MSDTVTACTLEADGQMPQAWVRQLLALFRACSVNIRKLTLLGEMGADCFSRLEMHFALPDSLGEREDGPFLELLAERLAEIRWRTLLVDPPVVMLHTHSRMRYSHFRN